MTKFSAWLRLIRVAALPTALADVWLGLAVVGRFAGWDILWFGLVSLALYSAGMILNDVHDVEEDKRDNPGRPLVSGEISVATAYIAGFTLLCAGVLGAACVGRNVALAAAALALLILAYNFLLKATLFGPVNMGLCRALNVILGMAWAFCWSAAAPIFVYIAGVTYLSRSEAQHPKRSQLVAMALIGIIPLQALVALAHSRTIAAGCIMLLLVPVFLLRTLSHIT